MVFDMMRQNFKLDDKIGASSSASSAINNNITLVEEPSDSAHSLRKQLSEINLTNQ
jgi:hypothetical protein